MAERMQCMEVWGGNDPTDTSLVTPGLDIEVYSSPFDGAARGGDVHYVSSCASGRITRMLIADVSGHGASVSDVATALRDLMRRYVNFIDQRRFVRAMNRRFEATTESGQFATALVSTWFAPRRRLTLCNAGHPPGLLYRAADGSWSLLGAPDHPTERLANVPLGVVGPAEYVQTQVVLAPGDAVLLYTDALSEARDETGRMLGSNGLLDAVRGLGGSVTGRLVSRLLDDLRRRHPSNLCTDDVTVLMLRANRVQPRLRDTLMAPVRALGDLAGARALVTSG
ncbi:MAG: PP2C family protein-serine/threonine phosphatase [Planctomycetota bacterium]